MAFSLSGTNGILYAYDYQTPTTGFSYTFPAGVQVLLMNPASTLATGTITMPAYPSDGMTVSFSSTQAIVGLTVSPNTGQTVLNGTAINLSAGQSVSYIYRLSAASWFSHAFVPKLSSSPIQSISASVAANALTISSSALNLDFRSTTLSDGTVTTVSGVPSNLVISTGTTLASASANTSRLAVIALNNAGTIELAVANLTGESNLDETTLVTTKSITQTSTFTGSIAVTTGVLTLSATGTGTFALGQAISGTGVPSGTYVKELLTGTLGAAASTYSTNLFNPTAVASTAMTGVAGIGFYSATARTAQPFRVVGYIESTQATAGTWATAPSTIQGYGGQALSALSSLGYGQTWQTFTVGTNRLTGATYYNTTGRPIMVSGWGTSATSTGISVYVNGVLVGTTNSDTTNGASNSTVTVIVPPGASYMFVNNRTNKFWVELR